MKDDGQWITTRGHAQLCTVLVLTECTLGNGGCHDGGVVVWFSFQFFSMATMCCLGIKLVMH